MAANPENLFHAESPPARALASSPRSLGNWLRRVSVNDWIVLGYLSALNVAILTSRHAGYARDRGILQMSCLLIAFFAIVVVAIRGGLLRHRYLTPLAFRIGHYGGIQLTYFFMRGFLPVVNPGSLDPQLHELGLRLFGVEPAIALEPWISSATTEWFAFFYYGYFFVLGLHVLPIIFLSRNGRILHEFALGILLVLAVGQSLYLVVPGYGPVRGLPDLFHTQLPSGVWWNLVTDLVRSAGAQKDIFPSIHTAAPTFILLFSLYNRAHLPYRFTWPLVAFFVFNIIIATMFLRWHWLVDIVAGLVLAFAAHVVSVRVTRWERRHRAEHGLPPAWPEWPPAGDARPAQAE
jgi:membrane-associated phospholipid phosphatase